MGASVMPSPGGALPGLEGQKAWQRRPRGVPKQGGGAVQGPPSAGGGGASGPAQAPQPQQTFAQLQQQGLARPAPPAAAAPQQIGGYAPTGQQSQFTNDLQGAVSKSLAAPSRYDLPQVQQVRDALTGQLQQQFGAQKKQIDEDMARRGLSASSIGAGYYGDLASNQANALSQLNASLIQNQAATSAGDLAASLGAGQNFQSAMANQGLAGYGANLQGAQANNAASMAQQQFNQGQYQNATQLALGAGQAQAQGQQFNQSLGEQGREFDIQQALAQKLGLGGLGVQQQQANTQTAAQQAQEKQFGQSMGEQGRQFDLQQALSEKLGLGNLGVQQKAQQAQEKQFGAQFGLSEKLGLGGLSLDQAREALNEKVQTGQLTLAQAQQALAEKQNSQQFGLQEGALTGSYGARAYNGDTSWRQTIEQNGNLHDGALEAAKAGLSFNDFKSYLMGVGKSEDDVTNIVRQAGLSPSDFGSAGTQTQSNSQFSQQLAQQLGIATMGDKTANRGIDANYALSQSDLLMRLAAILGIPTGSWNKPAPTPAPKPTGSGSTETTETGDNTDTKR